MKIKKNFYRIGIVLIGFLILSGFGCKDNSEQQEAEQAEPIEIVIWSLWDEQEVFNPILSQYTQLYPNVRFDYKKFTFEEYEDMVVNALAAGRGPDIWLLHNTWLPKHIDKLAPMTEGNMSAFEYSDTFVDVAFNDFVVDNQIYGIPLSVDTLALYYNKDLFNSAAITSPPATWQDFKEDVQALTDIDEFGDIKQAGAAIGTARNVNRAVDILYLLMIQNGTEMTDENSTRALFDQSATDATGEEYVPGLDALIFYTDFANPKKTIYTWNPTQDYNTDAFIEEEVAMMFNYSYQNEVIRGKAPRMNYGIAPAPQIKGSSKRYDYANYWGFAVANNSANKEVAWDVLTFLGKQENVATYCETTQNPASRRDVLNEQLQNPDLKVFAEQALTAQSWYQTDPSQIETIFADMIESVALGEVEPEQALSDTTDRVNVLMSQ